MIPDSFFPWPFPAGEGLNSAIAYLDPLLDRSDLGPYLQSPAGDLAEFIAAVCRDWDCNPAWLMVSAQREQSALVLGDFGPSALQAWLGYVGKDVGRVTYPGYYGIFTQVHRCASQTSWLFGRRVDGRVKSVERYAPGIGLTVDGQWYHPMTAGEYVQLAYTPHFKVLDINESLARRFAPQFLGGS